MDLLVALAQAALALAVFVVPGLAFAWCTGDVGFRSLAVAPAITLAIFGIGSMMASAVGMRWTLTLGLGVTSMACALVVVVRGRPAWPIRFRAPVGITLAVALSVIVQLVPVDGFILRRSQLAVRSSDFTFHLAVLQDVRDGHAPTPWRLGQLVDPLGQTSFYPAAWHAVAGTIPVLLDRTSVLAAAGHVVVGVAFTVGVVSLARAALPDRGADAWAALAVGAGLALPGMLAATAGVLPFATAIALVPALLARVAEPAVRAARGPLLGLAALGVFLCHPAGLVGFVLLALPWFVRGIGSAVYGADGRRRQVLAVSSLLVTAVLVLLIERSPTLRRMHGSRLSDPATVVGIARDVVVGPLAGSPALATVATLAAGLGLWSALRRGGFARASWSVIIAVVLYGLAAAGVGASWPLIAPFYSEARRIAPLVALWLAVLAGQGLMVATRWVGARLELPRAGLRRPLSVVTVGAILLLGSVVAVRTASPELAAAADPALAERGALTPDAVRMGARLVVGLGSSAVVLGDPATGVAQLYGRDAIATIPFYFGPLPDDLRRALADLGSIGTDPAVCRALLAHHVTHVLLRDSQVVPQKEWLSPIDSGGGLVVYSVTGCTPRPATSA